ncbi:MAG: hypothetical protein ABIQ74_14570 [Chitinophagales bacterium]
MVVTSQRFALHRIVESLGFSSIDEFALDQALKKLFEEVKKSNHRIEFFEKKYGMSYEEFSKNFHAIDEVELFEKEDDGMEWRTELVVLRNLEKDLAELSL